MAIDQGKDTTLPEIKGFKIPPIDLKNPEDWAVALLQNNTTTIAGIASNWLSRQVMTILGAILGTSAVAIHDTVYQTILLLVSGILLTVPSIISYAKAHRGVRVQNASIAVVTAIELVKKMNDGVVDFNDPQVKDILDTIMRNDGKTLVDAVQMYQAFIAKKSKIPPTSLSAIILGSA